MRVWLREQGYQVNHKRVTRLMELIGIAAIYPMPKLSASGESHTIYPYLLEGVEVKCVNHLRTCMLIATFRCAARGRLVTSFAGNPL